MKKSAHLIFLTPFFLFLRHFPPAPITDFLLLTSGSSFTVSCYSVFHSGLPTMIFKFLVCFGSISLYLITIYKCLLLWYVTYSLVTPAVKHGCLIFRCKFLSPRFGSFSHVFKREEFSLTAETSLLPFVQTKWELKASVDTSGDLSLISKATNRVLKIVNT